MRKIQITKDSAIETTESNDDNFPRQLLYRYLPYWPLFVLLVLLGAGTAYFYLNSVIPIYEISASILIKDERKGSATNTDFCLQAILTKNAEGITSD